MRRRSLATAARHARTISNTNVVSMTSINNHTDDDTRPGAPERVVSDKSDDAVLTLQQFPETPSHRPAGWGHFGKFERGGTAHGSTNNSNVVSRAVSRAGSKSRGRRGSTSGKTDGTGSAKDAEGGSPALRPGLSTQSSFQSIGRSVGSVSKRLSGLDWRRKEGTGEKGKSVAPGKSPVISE